MSAKQSRPGVDPQAAHKAFGGAKASVSAGLRLAGVRRINLANSASPDRLIQSATAELPGTEVTLVVAPRQHVSLAVDDLRLHGGHLGSVKVECADLTTRMVWIDALTNGVTRWVDPLGGDAA